MRGMTIGVIASSGQLINPFDGSISWDLAFNFFTGGTKNYGGGGNLTSGTGNTIPAFDSVQRAFRYRRSFSQNHRSQAAVSYTTPIHSFILFKTPSGFTGNQGLIAFSNTHRALLNGTQLQLSGIGTGVNLSTSTWYALQWYLNGTGSTYAIAATGTSMSAPTNISLGTSSIGTPNVRIGSEIAETSFFNGWIRYPFVYKGTLPSTTISNMKAFMNVA
jgi:hypothetical protein